MAPPHTPPSASGQTANKGEKVGVGGGSFWISLEMRGLKELLKMWKALFYPKGRRLGGKGLNSVSFTRVLVGILPLLSERCWKHLPRSHSVIPLHSATVPEPVREKDEGNVPQSSTLGFCYQCSSLACPPVFQVCTHSSHGPCLLIKRLLTL